MTKENVSIQWEELSEFCRYLQLLFSDTTLYIFILNQYLKMMIEHVENTALLNFDVVQQGILISQLFRLNEVLLRKHDIQSTWSLVWRFRNVRVVQNSFETCDVNQFNENSTEFGDAIIHEPHEITEFTAIILLIQYLLTIKMCHYQVDNAQLRSYINDLLN